MKNMTRDLLLFELAINTGANLKELLQLRVGDVKNKYYLTVNKKSSFPLNNEIISIINDFVKGKKCSDYLFQTKNGRQLDRNTIFLQFKEICMELALPDSYSVASWRKTFAYHHYKKYKDLSYLQWLFNQTTVDLTMRFIDVEENMNLRYREGIAL